VLHGAWAAAIALTGKYDQILNYVVSIDVLFFGLTGASLLVFRARAKRSGVAEEEDLVRVPWHPITTSVFVLACWAVSATTIVQYPRNAGIGVVILFAGAIVHQFWARHSAAISSASS
jgi:APA family basic amino acid/polyamine antiporter